MSFTSTPSASEDIESLSYESNSESQEQRSRFEFLWTENSTQDTEFVDSIYQEGIQDPVSWASSNFPDPAEESPGYVQNNHPRPPELIDDGRVCYGMIYQVEVKLSESNMPKLNKKLQEEAQVIGAERVLNFTVERKSDHLGVVFSDGDTLGMLSDSMFQSFHCILERGPKFFLEGVTPTHALRDRIGRIHKACDRKIRMDINVYGLRDSMKNIGDELSNKKLWLQKPDHYQKRFPYENPHFVSFPGISHIANGSNDVRETLDEGVLNKQDRIQRIVSEVHVSLQRAGELEITAGDRRLQTPLLDHQQRALTFMKQRESGDIPEKYRLWRKSSYEGQEMYIHRVTKTRSPLRPDEKGGGVLADEMGMGKSLCLLALVLETLDEGREWARQRQSEEYHSSNIKKYSRSTLVVVPSALLINNWLKEVQTHLGGSIKYFKYHGASREKDLEALSDSDLIVTTYQTLRSEYANKRSQLHKIEWFRIVLDEAHVIRRPSNTFYSTCLELQARSRWCLTGTPIQNRLMDIGALFAFLRAEPFNSIAQFRRWIVLPFEQSDEIVKDRLVLLYDSLCLRRNKDILHLPGTENHEVALHFSPEEKKQYDSTSKALQRSMSEKVGQYDKHREFGLFQCQLQLRILCNHGTYQKPFSWKRMALQLDESLAVGLGTGFESRCDGCEQLRPALVLTTNVCGHFWCTSCLEDLESMLGPENSNLCLRCHYKDAAKCLRTDTMPVRNNVHKQHHRDALTRSLYFKDVGFSTKMNRLVQDVKDGMEEMKSIVFSCWTYTMDLAGRHLKDAGVEYLRIDGDTLMSRRQQVLDDFDKDSGARVLLMTTGTGAFGLNITAARRVFILEPQWNPSVENQAIARTTRLNQKEKVLVIRYRIEGTVETEMLSQQKQKREIAKLGWFS
ncbi:SNF2 family N-terminal domain-containing protein [Xylaria flabelliformis]|nr:SNF2 family N-terminal domain-containing protein [Xylaria flabelliformis]